MTTKNGANGDGGKGNTKSRPNQSKRWCFTYNNYGKESLNVLQSEFNKKNISFVIGEEVGANGTPHLQGYIECPKKMRWTEIAVSKNIHWEKCKGDRDSNIKYCSKDGKYVCSKSLTPIKCIINLKPWQKNIEDLLKIEPDGRTLHWYWESVGGVGKSSFCKYMYVKHKVPTIQGGKLADIMNIIFNLDMGKVDMLLIDIPRNNKNNVSYSAIECILNGMITNTKFETGIKVFNPPHVVCLSNFEPDESKLSADRWDINLIVP